MPCPAPCAALALPLNGNRWYITAGDVAASAYIALLGATLSLSPANFPSRPATGERWRELRVITDPGLDNTRAGSHDTGPVFCLLPSPRDYNRLVIGMSLIALAIARAELPRGGLLIHGALAAAPENIGGGIILAGPAEVGKTTASNRLPPTWRSLSDDTTLVVRDEQGRYVAHPWPTWSRFFRAGDGLPDSGGKWDVQEGLPLRAIYFLKQANEDRIVPLPVAPAVTFLMETVQLVSSLMDWDLPADQIQPLHERQFSAAEKLARSIPAYTLHLSLTGTFWERIAETLAPLGKVPCFQDGPAPVSLAVSQEVADSAPSAHAGETISVCYTGTSMHPTLCSPDILEVVPYSGKPVRSGDVICYPSPTDGNKVVHRAIRITPEGIYTRGDNNPAADPYIVPQRHVIGRVAQAWRGGRSRTIAGGVGGLSACCRARISGRLNNIFSPMLHAVYHLLSARGPLRLWLPASLTPRIVEFRQRYQPSVLKLMVNGRVVGRFDTWQQLWQINRPWRLFIDAAKLPVLRSPPGDSRHTNSAVESDPPAR